MESKEITSKCLRIKINTGINSFDRRNLAINIERTNLIHTSQLCMKIQIVCPSEEVKDERKSIGIENKYNFSTILKINHEEG